MQRATGELGGQRVEVTRQAWAQVSVYAGGVAAREQTEPRRQLVRERDLADSRRARQFAHLAFQRARAVIAEHHHGHAVDSARAECAQFSEQLGVIGALEWDARAVGARVQLQDLVVQHARFLDRERKQLWAGLRPDLEQIGEAARDQEREALALALQERVRRQRGAHADAAGWDRSIRAQPEQLAHALERRAVRGQHLG
jgi:hypothetical protein